MLRQASALLVLGFLAAQSALAETALAVETYIVQRDEHVENLRQSQLANEWWQWAASMPSEQSPVRDLTGENCGVNQQGLIWNLAGGFGNSKIVRTCAVPSDRYIFFPVINMLVNAQPGSSTTCEDVKAAAARNNDRFVYIRVSINGVQITNTERLRVASQDCFDPFARNSALKSADSRLIGATDGYWVLLRPLPEGKYALEFSAFYTNPDVEFGDMVQNITYDLEITKP